MPTRLAAALLLVASPALAADPPADKGFPVVVAVGGSEYLCERPEVPCPAIAPVCDDPSVATVEDGGSRGLRIVGHKAGKTVCSVLARDTVRRVFAVTVH